MAARLRIFGWCTGIKFTWETDGAETSRSPYEEATAAMHFCREATEAE